MTWLSTAAQPLEPSHTQPLDPSRRSLVNHAVAVDHLGDWNLLEWWLHYLGAIAVPILSTALVVAAYLMCRAIVRLALSNLLEVALGMFLIAGAFAAAFLGLNWHIELLYQTLRHTSSATRAVLATSVVAILFGAASVALAVTLGVSHRRWLAVIALACAVPAVFSLVGDGLNRAATSSVPGTTSVGEQSPTGSVARSEPARLSLAPTEVLPRSPPAGQPGPIGPTTTSPLTPLSTQPGEIP